jgi:membrane-associated phospholipid phosphatase
MIGASSTRCRSALFAWSFLFPVMGIQSEAHAQEPTAKTELHWASGYQQARVGNYALIGVTGGVALAGLLITPDRHDPWRATLGVDETVRDVIRLSDAEGRQVARTTSDILAGLSVTLPTLGDAWLNAAWQRKSPAVAWEMTIINLEVLGLTAAVVGTAKWAFSRERPFGRLCGTEFDAGSKQCTDNDRYVSYFSGHAAFTFAASSALCVHHHHFELWGEVSPWVPCAAGYAVAATTGALRMAADRHYVSDVLTGAVVGTAIGLVVPWLHYSYGSSEPGPDVVVSANGSGATLRLLF